MHLPHMGAIDCEIERGCIMEVIVLCCDLGDNYSFKLVKNVVAKRRKRGHLFGLQNQQYVRLHIRRNWDGGPGQARAS